MQGFPRGRGAPHPFSPAHGDSGARPIPLTQARVATGALPSPSLRPAGPGAEGGSPAPSVPALRSRRRPGRGPRPRPSPRPLSPSRAYHLPAGREGSARACACGRALGRGR